MTLTRAKLLMRCAHSIWPDEVRKQQPREYRRRIEHGWFRLWAGEGVMSKIIFNSVWP
jgi:hypothetical protein